MAIRNVTVWFTSWLQVGWGLITQEFWCDNMLNLFLEAQVKLRWAKNQEVVSIRFSFKTKGFLPGWPDDIIQQGRVWRTFAAILPSSHWDTTGQHGHGNIKWQMHRPNAIHTNTLVILWKSNLRKKSTSSKCPSVILGRLQMTCHSTEGHWHLNCRSLGFCLLFLPHDNCIWITRIF